MELKLILEAILFSAQKPLAPEEIRETLKNAAREEEAEPEWKKLARTRTDDLLKVLEELAGEHEAAGRSFRLVCVGGAWQFVSQPEYAPWLRALVGKKNRPPRLTQPALETLAIIAYRQPITRSEMEQVRGVSVDGVLQKLLERGLVEQSGRSELPGRPALFVTTPIFLDYFGLKSLEELPNADELRRLPVDRPEGPVTTDSGLATPPPEAMEEVDSADAVMGESGGSEGGESTGEPGDAGVSSSESAPEATGVGEDREDRREGDSRESS